jgi:O-antigen/teichoic acid export membrane protein
MAVRELGRPLQGVLDTVSRAKAAVPPAAATGAVTRDPPPDMLEQPSAAQPSVGRDILSTSLTQASIAIGGLLLYRLIAVKQGAEGVASYSLVKQLVVFIWPVVMLGLQTGIPRYVALGRDRAGSAETYLVTALALTGTATALVCAAALASPRDTASLLFGDPDRTNLVVPLVLTLAATVALEVTYGYYRGRSAFRVGNAIRVVSVASFPVVLLVVAGHEEIGTLISLMAVAVLACCALAAVGPVRRGIRGFSIAEEATAARTLLNYGVRRIPGDLAAVVLFAVPTALAAHYVPLKEVAFLSAGLYVLAMIAIAFQPVGLVFLPLLSRLCKSDFDSARRYVQELATCALHIAILVTPLFVLFAHHAVRAWLGPDFEDSETIVSIAVAPAGVYAFNVILRSALDAAAVTAYNSRNNLISVAVAATAVSLGLATDAADPLNCIAWSFALGVFCLGMLTLISVHRVFRLRAREYHLPLAVALGALAALAAWIVHHALIGEDHSVGSLVGIAALTLALAAAYVGALVRAGVTWPAEIRDRLLRRA